MAFESNDFLHANGISHEHGADGSITSVGDGSGGDRGGAGSSIQSSDLERTLGDIQVDDKRDNPGRNRSNSSGSDELDVKSNEKDKNKSNSGSSGNDENSFLHEEGIEHTHNENGDIVSIDGNPVGAENYDGSHNHGGSGGSNDHDHTGAGAANLPNMGSDYSTQNGTLGSDTLIGGDGNDFLFRGDETLNFSQAFAKSGAEEFPFPNTSKGSSEANISLEDGTLKIDGNFKDFQGAPLFSQGEDTIDPRAEILNGSDPVSLINNFKAVPEDVEGNPLSGVHLHFGNDGDGRAATADATVLRFLNNELTDAESGSGTFSGEFKLTPEEQTALAAGNLYLNLHTNNSLDGDIAGFPTGENRLNLNQNVVNNAVAV